MALSNFVEESRGERGRMMTTIPKDPVMLLSFVNTQLRDQYFSLEELCRTLDLEQEELEKKLAAIDYHYAADRNQFV